VLLDGGRVAAGPAGNDGMIDGDVVVLKAPARVVQQQWENSP
jgi:hypothetical protein